MKSTLKLLPMALLVLLPFSSFAGGNSGGGGGGICLENKKCVTLAQAGLRIKEAAEDQNNLLTTELLSELESVINQLPPQLHIYADDVIGKKNDIREVQIDNQKKLKSFIKEYQQILEENGDLSLAKYVELMAFTSREENQTKVTYLIREKFDALDARGQALILIHEYLLRVRNLSLKDALIFDGTVLDYLTALEENKRPDATGLIRISEKLHAGYINSYYFNEALIGKSPLATQNFTVKKDGDESTIVLSYKQILQLSKSYPKMKFVKDNETVVLQNMGRMSVLKSFLNYLIKDLSGFKTVVLNKEYVEKFQGQYNIMSSYYNVCESYSDQSSWIVANETDRSLNFSLNVDCALYPLNLKTEYPVYPDTFETIFKNINGLDMNFEKEITCRFAFNRSGSSTPEVSCK